MAKDETGAGHRRIKVRPGAISLYKLAKAITRGESAAVGDQHCSQSGSGKKQRVGLGDARAHDVEGGKLVAYGFTAYKAAKSPPIHACEL